MAPGISARDIIARRLRAQSVLPQRADSPVVAVRGMLAIQAQDFAAGCWAIGVRTRDSTMADVTTSLESGAVVRSWPMRGTLHFVAAEDLRWLLAITTKRMLAGVAGRQKQLELDERTLALARDIVTDQLSGGRSLGRDEVMAALEAGGIGTAGQRGYQLIYHLAQTGVVCWGPPRKNQQALVLVDEWIPRTAEVDRNEALGRLVVSYLQGHGPASLADFQWWSKLTVADVKVAVSAAGPDIAEFDVAGKSYWMTAQAAEPLPTARSAGEVAALPGFDEYVLGYQDRSLVLTPERFRLIVPGSNGVFLPIIVAGGTVAGTWRRTSTSAGVDVTPTWFSAASASMQLKFAKSVRRYERFLGVPVTVRTVGNGVTR